MFNDATKYSIEEVIKFCKESDIYIVNREKNRTFYEKINKTEQELIEEVRGLRVVNSCAEPELDYGKNKKGYVYQFKKLVFERYWCYIKLKIRFGKIVVVLSFHEDEEEAKYDQK